MSCYRRSRVRKSFTATILCGLRFNGIDPGVSTNPISAILLSYYRNRSYPIVEIRIRRLVSSVPFFLLCISVFVCIPRPSYYLHDIIIYDVIREKVNRLSRLGCLGHSNVEMYQVYLNPIRTV